MGMIDENANWIKIFFRKVMIFLLLTVLQVLGFLYHHKSFTKKLVFSLVFCIMLETCERSQAVGVLCYTSLH